MEYNYWKIKTEDLPSKGLYYDDDFEILVRPLSVLDVRYLHTINNYNASDIINELLMRCVLLRNMEYKDLLLADREFLSFWIRANSFKNNSGFKISINNCPICHHSFDQSFKLENFNTKFIQERIDEVYLPRSEVYLKLKLPRVKDLKNIPFDVEMNEYKKFCVFIDSEASFEEKYNFIQNLNVYDFTVLKSAIRKLDCGMDKHVLTDCPVCHHCQKVEIKLNPNQLFSRIELSDVLNTISRICKYSGVQIDNSWLWMEVEFEQDEINKMIKEENAETQKEINKAKSKTNNIRIPSNSSIPHISTPNIH